MASFTDNHAGLSQAQAIARLRRFGYNELPSQKPRSFWKIVKSVLAEPMLLLLAVGVVVYFLLGEAHDALMLTVMVFFVVGITIYQERKTERALDALKNLSSPRALVLRGGKAKRLAGREVVPEDLLILREGDRVAADAELLSATNLLCDESLLTGESLPVAKTAATEPLFAEQAKSTRVYAGTLIIRGHGLGRVTATGITTEMGLIGKALEKIIERPPLLKRETARLVKIFGSAGLALCLSVIVLVGLFRDGWLEGVLYGLTVGMSLLPEEFPVILVIFLTLGAWRLSRHQVLARNAAAVESLGATSVLCVDKTGTLTRNRLTLEVLATDGERFELPASGELPTVYRDLLTYAKFACPRHAFDPLDKEIMRLSREKDIGRQSDGWQLIREYPFAEKITALANVWQEKNAAEYLVAAKGAPEAIAELCGFDEAAKKQLAERFYPLIARGLRLIGVAYARPRVGDLPEDQRGFAFQFAGWLGFSDPVRPEVAAALADCYAAGVRVCMITGDYPATAQFIARKIKLRGADAYLTGDDLRRLNKEELREQVRRVNIFARVLPEQKLLIVEALRANGEIIAMTGDGVNDAPALKAAHSGLAMGERGTDVAREASDLVILDDDFSSIIRGIRLGRTVFDNLKKAIAYVFSVHIPLAGLSVLPLLFGLPVIFFPAHIAFLELIIDPACSVVFESEPAEKNVMRRPPRNLRRALFGKKELFVSLAEGIIVLLAAAATWLYADHLGASAETARAMVFISLVVGNLMLIINNLSWTRGAVRILQEGNRALYVVAAGAVLMLAAVLRLPQLRELFHFSLLGIREIAIAAGFGLISLFWFEAAKTIWGQRRAE